MTRLSRPLAAYGPKLVELLIAGSQARAVNPIRIKDKFSVLKRLQNELYALRRAMKNENDHRYQSVAPVTLSFGGKHKAGHDDEVELLIFRASTEYDTLIDTALSTAVTDPTLATVPIPTVAMPDDPLAAYEPEEDGK